MVYFFKKGQMCSISAQYKVILENVVIFDLIHQKTNRIYILHMNKNKSYKNIYLKCYCFGS